MGADGVGAAGFVLPRQTMFDHTPHRLHVEVVEVVGRAAADLGQAGAPRQKHRLAEVHGLDGRQAEAFGQRRKQEARAVRIGPGLLRVVDAQVELHIGQLDVGAQPFGVVAGGAAQHEQHLGPGKRQIDDGLRVLRRRHAAQVIEKRPLIAPVSVRPTGQRFPRGGHKTARAVVNHLQRPGPAQALAHVAGGVVTDGHHLVGALHQRQRVPLVAPG